MRISSEIECSICNGDFDMDGEGGIAGDIGILPVAFCPTCYAGIEDMIHQASACPHCGKPYEIR